MLAQKIHSAKNFHHSRIHVVIFSIFLFILGRRWRRRFLLFHEIFPVQRARGVQFEPGRYAFEVEHVVLVAGEADD